MKRKLLICNTYMQLIVAIQLRRTLFSGDLVDLWLSNHSVNSEKVAKNLESLGLFRRVIHIPTKAIVYETNYFKKVLNAWLYGTGKKRITELELYDEVVFYNTTSFVVGLHDTYRRLRHEAVWSRLEEGILSYGTFRSAGKTTLLVEDFRKFLGHPPVQACIQNHYSFQPGLQKLDMPWNNIQVPLLDQNDQELVTILRKAFDFDRFTYPQKYIFFASALDVDGHPFGETELILRIAEKVGKENLLVKMHPRDTRRVYQDHGIQVMENSYIPWEVVQVCSGLQDRVLLTAVSGAFLTSSAMMQNPIEGRFLFPDISSTEPFFLRLSRELEDVLSRMHRIGLCDVLKIQSFWAADQACDV